MYEAREPRGYQGTARGARRKRAGGLLVGRGPAGPAGAMANSKLTWTAQRRVNQKVAARWQAKRFHEEIVRA
jgi:hypothetical protein